MSSSSLAWARVSRILASRREREREKKMTEKPRKEIFVTARGSETHEPRNNTRSSLFLSFVGKKEKIRRGSPEGAIEQIQLFFPYFSTPLKMTVSAYTRLLHTEITVRKL